MAFRRVVFPAPLAPKIPILSPFWMSRLMSWRMFLPPRSTDTFSAIRTFLPDLWAAWILMEMSLFSSGLSFSSILEIIMSLVL